MHSDKYNFEAFIERVKSLDHHDIVIQASAACAAAEHASYGKRGAVKARESGSTTFASRVKDFLFFLRSGSLPTNVFIFDLRHYKDVAELLVAKKQLKKEVLGAFDGKL